MARKNTLRVLKALAAGKSDRRDDSIWTDGSRLMSYGTVLLEEREDGRTFVNLTRYSPTTTRHQSGVVALVDFDAGVFGVPRGDGSLTWSMRDGRAEVVEGRREAIERWHARSRR